MSVSERDPPGVLSGSAFSTRCAPESGSVSSEGGRFGAGAGVRPVARRPEPDIAFAPTAAGADQRGHSFNRYRYRGRSEAPGRCGEPEVNKPSQ